MRGSLVFGSPKAQPMAPDDRVGSNPEVRDGHANVASRGQSRSRFRATGLLNLAEAVEEVGADRFCATIVPVG